MSVTKSRKSRLLVSGPTETSVVESLRAGIDGLVIRIMHSLQVLALVQLAAKASDESLFARIK